MQGLQDNCHVLHDVEGSKVFLLFCRFTKIYHYQSHPKCVLALIFANAFEIAKYLQYNIPTICYLIVFCIGGL